MAEFKYSAKDKSGRTLTGNIQANSEADVIEALHKKELVIVSVEEEKSGGSQIVRKEKIKNTRVKPDDLVIFSRQLATMIDAGIPLVQSLSILGEQIENKALQLIILKVRQDIESGKSFCDALSSHPGAFSELFINMVKAGEASGTLDEVLDRLASYSEKSLALARKIRSSLIYPAVVISMAILITAFLLLKVVPTFKGIFDTLGGELPLPTQILIGISEIFKQFFLFIVIGIIIGAFLLKKYVNTEKGKYNFDFFKLKVWVLGTLFQKVALAKFSRTLSTLVKSGVSIISSLDIVAKTSGNKVVEETILKARTSVREGEPIAKQLSKGTVFPPMVTRMISVGEQTGQLEKMLSKIADFYDDQVDAAVSGLTSMIEPLVIAFLGIVIGGIVVALFLPIFKITELLGK